jgi:beta-glucanase (GH16 family)
MFFALAAHIALLRGVLAGIVVAVAWPVAAGDRSTLLHEDDFSRRCRLDPTFWLAETGFFRNREAQYYRPENAFCADGALVLEGRRENVANAGYDPQSADWMRSARSAHYTSGSLVSRDAFRYGAFEIVARLPQGGGSWPAIWLVGEGRPYREIDIVEALGKTPGRAYVTIHAGPDVNHLRKWSAETPLPDLAGAFHAYRLEWRENEIRVLIDGKEIIRLDPQEARGAGIDPFHEPMRLRLNFALGGSWGGLIDDAALPARMAVKSVRIWRLDP